MHTWVRKAKKSIWPWKQKARDANNGKIDSSKFDVNKNRFMNLLVGFRHWDTNKRFLNIKK